VDDDHEYDGADGCGSERIEEAAGSSAYFELTENPAAEDRADQAEQDVCEAPIAAAASDFSSEPARDEAEKDPAYETTIDYNTKDLIHVRECEKSGEHAGSLIKLMWTVV
jgi:hypothetical protein